MSESVRVQLERLPGLLGAHINLTLAALALGMLLTAPLAYASIRSRRVRGAALACASVVQTAPSLAVLALMVAAFGLFGWPAALAALTAYSVLPVLRNAVTGALSVDPAVIEAARGVGMTERQALLRVRLPLAAPVIIAGVRTAVVWVVGIATLSTPVGASSLGNYIFGGLQTRNTTAVLTGVIAAAALALALDGLVRLLEVGVIRRSRTLVAAGALGLGAVASFGIATAVRGGAGGADRVVIGAKTFTEQFILARVIEGELEAAGLETELREGLGSTILFEALAAGDVDVCVDYTGTLWVNHMKREPLRDPKRTLRGVADWLDETRGALALGALGFDNTYAIAMREDAAQEAGAVRISDLRARAGRMEIGGDYEFFDRPEWAAFRREYGFRFGAVRSYDSTLMYEAVRQGEVDVITAFATDGRIDAYGLRVLEDDRGAFPPYDAVVLVSAQARQDQRILGALERLIGEIPPGLMRRANALVDVEGQTPDAAAEWLRDRISSD